MADSRKSDANASSMVDLKAELFRKQEEFKRLKAAGSTEFVKGRKAERHGKTDIFSRKNAGVSQRAQLDLEKKEEEDNVMEKSRRALEAKSKIYEKIASRPDIPEEDGSDGYLVDFQRKAIDKIVEDRRKGEGQSINLTTEGDSDDDSALGELPLPPSNPDEEWVDYVDSFGRSRRCMKKDLPYLEKQERPLSKLASDLGLKVTSSDSPTLLSEDMRRELRRQQWEKEAQEAANGPIHYANVQFDEIRTHGVGYYQFSKDSNLREEQMDTLNKLREQTMEERMRSERIKEKRKAALEARLAKVKQRRKMKGGTLLDVEDSEDTAESVPTEQKADAVKVEKKTEPEPLTRDDSWRRDAPVREWDKGKEKMPEWNAKRYMEQRRTEREEEFAPPQIYFEPQVLSGKPPPRTSQGAGIAITKSAGRTETSAVERHTETMLRQMRNSVAPASTVPSSQDDLVSGVSAGGMKVRSVNSSGGTEPESRTEKESAMDIDLSAIPLPPADGNGSESSTRTDYKDGFRHVSQGPSSTMLRPTLATGPPHTAMTEYVSGHEAHSQSLTMPGPTPMIGPPAPNFSVPPPGWPRDQTQFGPQPVCPPPSHPPGSYVKGSVNSRVPAGVGHPMGTADASLFMYPSQQGLLTSEPGQQSSMMQQRTSGFSQPSTGKPTIPKMNLVDKRFMQNRELPIDDLLSEMEDSSKDILQHVKPVSYQPGIFSKSAVSGAVSSTTTGSVERPPEPVRASTTSPKTEGDSGTSQAEHSQSSKPGEARTESVIFGVPDFLQPAAGVEAKVYQPGSFMAAKEAAAQRAEEGYEASRRKKQYSSAPVMYGQTSHTEVEKTDRSVKEGTESEKGSTEHIQEGQKDTAEEEVQKFLRDLHGGK